MCRKSGTRLAAQHLQEASGDAANDRTLPWLRARKRACGSLSRAAACAKITLNGAGFLRGTLMEAKVLDADTRGFDVDDVEYLRHGGRPLLARVFKPKGDGPFPALVEVHGGAWCLSDRTTERLRHEYMASHGIVSVALDFRSGNE